MFELELKIDRVLDRFGMDQLEYKIYEDHDFEWLGGSITSDFKSMLESLAKKDAQAQETLNYFQKRLNEQSNVGIDVYYEPHFNQKIETLDLAAFKWQSYISDDEENLLKYISENLGAEVSEAYKIKSRFLPEEALQELEEEIRQCVFGEVHEKWKFFEGYLEKKMEEIEKEIREKILNV